MSLKVSKSLVMSDLMAFNESFISAASKVDLATSNVPHDTVCTNIGNHGLVYALGKRKVEVSMAHCDTACAFFTDDVLVLLHRSADQHLSIDNALRWLTGYPINCNL